MRNKKSAFVRVLSVLLVVVVVAGFYFCCVVLVNFVVVVVFVLWQIKSVLDVILFFSFTHSFDQFTSKSFSSLVPL